MAKLCFTHIGTDPGLFALPLYAGSLIVLSICMFFAGLWLTSTWDMPAWFGWIILLLFILLLYLTVLIKVLFEAAMVAYAHEEMEVGRGSVSQGLATAWVRARPLAGWAFLSTVATLFFRESKEKDDTNGMSGFVRAEDGELMFYSPWATETYFMLPVILYEDRDFEGSMEQSRTLAIENWGPFQVARLTRGLVFLLLLLPGIIGLFYYIFSDWNTGIVLPLLVTVTYMILLISVRSVGSTVLQAAMFRYARTGRLDVGLPNWIQPYGTTIQQPRTTSELERSKMKADVPATKDKPDGHGFLYWFKGVMAIVVFLMVVFGFMALDDYANEGEDSLLTAVGLCSSALVIVVIMFALGWIESVPDSSSEPPVGTSATARSRPRAPLFKRRQRQAPDPALSRPPAPPVRPRQPSQTASAPARVGPKVGEPVLVSFADGGELRGMATRIEYGMVTVMLNDGAIAQFAEQDCILCDG
jgi:hypothetical protein